MTENRILLVGLGSGRGDDQAGWRVAELVRQRERPGVTVRRARAPDELLDWIRGIRRLVLCDACQGSGPVGSWQRWRWPDVPGTVQFSGRHDPALPAILGLAARLEQLPPETVIWAIEGRLSEPPVPHDEAKLSPEVEAAVPDVARRIDGELGGRC